MTLKWRLSLVIVGAVLVVVLVETIAASTVNLSMATFAAREWLTKSANHGISAVTEDTYAQLELGLVLVSRDLKTGDENDLPLFEQPGWFWAIASNTGAAGDRSAQACAQFGTALAPGDQPRRGGVICNGRPSLIVSRRLASHRWLVLGRVLDDQYLDRLAAVAGTELTVIGPNGLLLSTSRATDGTPHPISFDSGLEQRALELDGVFETGRMTARGHQWYRRGTEPIEVGETFIAFTHVSRISSAEQLPIRLLVWVPAAVMTGGGYYSMLVLIGTLLVLPLLLGFAWLVASRATRPLGALAEVARQVSLGRLDVRAPPNLTGEVGQLAAAFDQMIVGLQHAQSRGALSEKLAAIGQLAGGVAHEINNPMGVILGFAQGMERRVPEDDPLRLPVTSIVREALRCKALIQELLVFSRTGKKSVEALDLNALTRSTTTLLEARARTQGVEVVCDFAGATVPLSANRTQLQQVIVNLGTNALDAMAAGGTLTLRTRQQNQQAMLEITDTGEGIDPSVLGRIFDPFFTTKDVGKGTGLGLSLVHEIVKQHGGDIHVESKQGVGTTMRVTFPTGAAA